MAANRGIGKVNINPLFNVQALCCFYYMALGAYIPFINLYYERLGLSGVQIGTLAALPVLITATITFLWAATADAFRLHRVILQASFLLAAIVVYWLSQAKHFVALIPWVFAYAFVTSPISPLLDSNALEVAKQRQRSYGGLRVWGSAGWAVSTWLVGLLIEARGTRWFFYSYIVLMSVAFLFSLFQPARKLVQRSSLIHGLREMFRVDFILFLISAFLLTTASGGVNSFFSLYLDRIGATEGQIGFSWALAAVSELPVMIFSAVIVRRIVGNGPTFGEYGGATEIAMKALHMVNYAWIKRIPPTSLTQILLNATGAKDELDLMEGTSNDYYHLSSHIGLEVINAARSRDASACEVIRWAGEELGWLAVSVARQIDMENEEVEVIQSGSIFKAGAMITDPMRDVVLRHCPKARLIRLDGPPVVGAVILGMEQARFDGYSVRDLMIRTAKEILG